jgi:maltodextrin utilization protein YvdJ
MFLIDYFRYSFSFTTLFDHGNERVFKVIIYLVLLSLVSAFPLNYLIVREQGWRLDFIEESFLVESPDWVLPDDCEIRADRLVCDTDEVHHYTHRDIAYVINGTADDFSPEGRTVILTREDIIYVNAGSSMVSTGYSGFSDTVSFREINLMDGAEKNEALDGLAAGIEGSFSRQIVFYTLVVNSVITLLSNTMFVVLLAVVIQMFRFGFSTFMSFGESVRFIIFAMGLPAVLSLIVGLFVPAFSTVFFQLAMGLVTMLVMLIVGRKKFA